MKKLMVLAAIMVASVCAVSAQEAEEGSPLSFDVTADIYSAYVWRGQVLDKHAVLQPGATATFDLKDAGSISANVWMNWDVSQKSKHTTATRTGGGINELDGTLSYSKDFGPVGFTVGHIWYVFPGAGWPKDSYSTEEVFVSLAYNNDVVTPYVNAYYDYNVIKGAYVNAGLNKEVAVNDQLTLGGDLSLGGGSSHYVNGYFGEHSTSLTDFNAKLYASYALTDTFSVGATLAYTVVADSDLHAKGDNIGDGGIVWGGINLGASF
jgi:hypothetical protein